MKNIKEIEAKRQADQVRLDQAKSAKERNELGQFATPPELALDIARDAWGLLRRRTDKVRFLDPGIGTGSFYAALRQVFPADKVAGAAGVEVDSRFVSTARKLWKDTGLSVKQGDFTKQKPPKEAERFNLVLTNPPYVRHHHLEREEKERLQGEVARMGIKISGLAGLYCYFMLLCDRWMADDGIAAWLVPSEFMDVNYGTALKEYLTRHVTLLKIHRFSPSDVQFADALVTSAIVVFKKAKPNGRRPVKFSYGGSLLKPTVQERVPLAELVGTQKWTNHPAGTGNGKQTDASELTLGDVFTIKRGLATGANQFFILPKERAKKLVPSRFLRPILPSPRYLPDLVIEADDEGYPQIEQPLALIDCDLTEDEVQDRYPEFWSHLEDGKKNEIHSRYLTRGRSPWYSQEKRPAAPFLCTYMGRNREQPFRFIWNKSQATAANVYLLLYPKEPLAAVLEEKPELYPVVFKFLQAISPENFLGEGRVYGGGLFKMEPKELARLSAEPLLKTAGLAGSFARQQQLAFA